MIYIKTVRNIFRTMQYFRELMKGLSFGLSFAVSASVNALFFVGQFEYVVDLLLDGSDASWVFALDNIHDLFRELRVAFFNDNIVFDDVYGDARVDEAEQSQIYVELFVDLDDVLFAHLLAHYVLDDCNRAVKLVEIEIFVQFHALACRDVVYNYSVFYRIYSHFIYLREYLLYLIPRSLRIRAILMCLPQRA